MLELETSPRTTGLTMVPARRGDLGQVPPPMSSEDVACDDGVMVGDTMEDASAAARVGIPFILMRHGYGDPSHISSLPVARAIDHFSQLLELLTKEPALD